MTESVMGDLRQLQLADPRRCSAALQASEVRYRRLFEAARDGILILDADSGKIIDVNPFLLELTGFARDDFLGAFLWEIGPFKDTAASKDSFAALLTNKYARYDDLPLQARDGRRIPVEFVSNVYLVDGQNVIQCNIWDITERKRADQTEETLRRSEEKFRILFDQAADCILLLEITPEGIPVIRDANSATFRLLGYERDELIGQPVSLIDAAPDVSKAVGERRRDVISGATSMFEVSHRCKDGAIRDFECSVTEMQVASVTFAISVERDITARKQAEAERNRLEEQLRAAQKMEAIGGLAGGIAHDFNNLLSVILSFTGFAMDAVREGGPLRDDLLEVKKAGERAAVLTRQLLAFSRKQVLRAVPVNLNEIAAAVEKMLRRILGEDIDFVQVLAPDLGLTRADPGQIEQVIMNLVVNARDAMPEGGKLTIETGNVEVDEEYAARHVAVRPGSYVQLVVTDTGCGMDAKTKARLFEPFFTTKEKGKGTGLGLSTAYGIVKQSGGDIWVYSEPGGGTTFKIYLPRDRSAAQVTATKPPTVPRQSTGTETILLVEDEEALRRVAERALAAAGYTVLTAAGGEAALQTSAQHAGEIHLLLTDVVMPQMSGKALAQQLCRARPPLKVLYMSGYTDDAIVHHGVLDPGTHFLGKPFTAADLTRKVREVLDSAIAGPGRGSE